ncbi:MULTISPECIES: DeoR/GlpR family DNA-binding transcription regulator [Halanaerobium]|jgi:DeoR/GlpR family transcriptional regulator of sugar metabolism|uniref:Transcriptional regulator, DeoR family n=1 Tax=Halanaerobium kushneri TaxID=56779 RepID=A0A1N6QUQ7_9FIRM|nr:MULTISPECIES: DeoR/GlpR family DNA-binding transcription regulator [Halanaerobium]RCW61073.1 DeoR family transcriptional regulator [Halanaerobium sp. ST460_2HS_T2]SIQ20319.1 transcriptional regulator, DeoR family [Halanaerobium kushneri]
MLAEERRQRILEKINIDGTVHVSDLSEELDVTEETIRRDLDVLDERELLSRIHGGAVAIETNSKAELSFNVRENKMKNSKTEIAKKAVNLIEEGETIFLDASTTAMYLARELANLNNLTVITNSIKIMMELIDYDNITVISTGGTLRSNSFSFVGPLANETVKKYFADKIFASCKGITVQHGATDSNELEIEVKENMIKQTNEIIILADHCKLNQTGLAKFVNFEDIDTLITDSNADIKIIDEFESAGLKVV